MFSHAQQFTINSSTLTNVQGHQFNTTVTNKFSVISLGDIFSVFDLARKLAGILSDSRGSSREYQELILEIDSLSSALEDLHNHQTLVISAGGLNPPPSSIRNAIGFALSKCRALMKDFMEKIEGYQSGLRRGGSGSRMWDSWLKMGWAFFKTEELVDLKSNLMEQKLTIITMIAMSNSHNIFDVKQITHRNEQVTHQHGVTLKSIQHSIERLPCLLGYSWEDRRPLWLIDVLGVKTPLPLELCANWEVFDGVLKVYFKNRAGQKYIERGDYDLTGRDNQVINTITWNSYVKPGMTINMSIILRLLGLEDSRQCPNCKQISPHATPSGGEIVCVFCQTSFRVSDSFIEEVEENQNTESTRGPHDIPAKKVLNIEPTLAVEDETRFFRRIHVISTKLRAPPSRKVGDYLIRRNAPPFQSRNKRRKHLVLEPISTSWPTWLTPGPRSPHDNPSSGLRTPESIGADYSSHKWFTDFPPQREHSALPTRPSSPGLSGPRPPLIPNLQPILTSWASWKPNPDVIPTPWTDPDSPGLFGPRSPHDRPSLGLFSPRSPEFPHEPDYSNYRHVADPPQGEQTPPGQETPTRTNSPASFGPRSPYID